MAVMPTFELCANTSAARTAIQKIDDLVVAFRALPLSPEAATKVGDLALQLVELALRGIEVTVRERRGEAQ